MIAVMRWRGPVSAMAGPAADGKPAALPIPSRGAICGLIGAALGLDPEDARDLRPDLAVVVHDAGRPFTEYRTADLLSARLSAAWVASDGSVRNRAGASGKARAERHEPRRAGFDASILVGGMDAGELDAALRRPAFDLCLGARECRPSVPVAAGTSDRTIEAHAATLDGETWRLLAGPEGGAFGLDLVAIPERAGAISWWLRHPVH